jgi:hypothetical protein
MVGISGRVPGRGTQREEDLAMKATVGDRLVLEGTHVGDHRRIGVITSLRHDDGSPPYVVRWLDDGHEALVFPGPDSRVEHVARGEEGAQRSRKR